MTGSGWTRRAALFGALLAASRCGSPPPPPPPPPSLDLAIEAGADQNPDAGGHPTGVAVRLYQLGATGSFERADIFALTEREAATLGAEMIASEEFLVAPGEKRKIARELKHDTQFIGVAVLFRDIDGATWRVTAPTLPSGPTKLVLRISGTKAVLEAA